jgi:hypothetical protein
MAQERQIRVTEEGRRLEVASTATTQAAAEALVQSEEMRSRLPAEGMEALGSLLASPDRQ